MTIDENTNITEVLHEAIDLPASDLGLNHHNNTHYFLCPLFNVKGVLKFRNNYLNSYIEDNGRQSYIDCPLYCLFKFKDLEGDESNKVRDYFQAHPLYAFSYYAGVNEDNNLVMYVLKASDEIKQDYKHVVNGRYSHTSQKYRDMYKAFGFIKPTVSFIDEVVTKNPSFKRKMEAFLDQELDEKSELWNIFEPEREVFRFKK